MRSEFKYFKKKIKNLSRNQKEMNKTMYLILEKITKDKEN